jgi:hypothetical protein
MLNNKLSLFRVHSESGIVNFEDQKCNMAAASISYCMKCMVETVSKYFSYIYSIAFCALCALIYNNYAPSYHVKDSVMEIISI